MKPKTLAATAGIGSVLVFAGCSTNPKAEFGDVQRTIKERSGHTVMWTRDESGVADVQNQIDALLQTNLTVEAAVQIALVNNPRLQATFEEIGIAKADLVQAGLLRNPRFAGSWRFPDSPPSAANTEYSVTGDILNAILLPLRKKIAARNLGAVKLRVADEVLRLIAEVKGALYTAQAREQLVTRIRIIVDVNEASAEIAKRRHDAGNITDLEYADEKAIYAQSRVNLAEAQKELRVDRERLNRLLGLWGHDTAWHLADELPSLPQKEIGLENLEALAVSQRLDLAAFRAQLTNAAAVISLQTKTRFIPTTVDVGIDTEKGSDGGSDGQRVTGPTLDLELPIFDQGQAAIAKLAAQYRQAQQSFRALAIDVRSEVREARDRLIANRDLAEYYRSILLPLRIKIVNQTMLQYNAMQIGPADLLLSKERELETERAYVEAWRDYWIARADLEKAVGGNVRPPPESVSPVSTENSNNLNPNHTH